MCEEARTVVLLHREFLKYRQKDEKRGAGEGVCSGVVVVFLWKAKLVREYELVDNIPGFTTLWVSRRDPSVLTHFPVRLITSSSRYVHSKDWKLKAVKIGEMRAPMQLCERSVPPRNTVENSPFICSFKFLASRLSPQ